MACFSKPKPKFTEEDVPRKLVNVRQSTSQRLRADYQDFVAISQGR
jgi:hypothetical protein